MTAQKTEEREKELQDKIESLNQALTAAKQETQAYVPRSWQRNAPCPLTCFSQCERRWQGGVGCGEGRGRASRAGRRRRASAPERPPRGMNATRVNSHVLLLLTCV